MVVERTKEKIKSEEKLKIDTYERPNRLGSTIAKLPRRISDHSVRYMS